MRARGQEREDGLRPPLSVRLLLDVIAERGYDLTVGSVS